MTEAYLIGVNLVGADLSEADLEKAQLGHAHLEEAQLLRTNLKRSHLQEAYLTKAKLHFAHLEQADLGLAHLDEAYLTDKMGVGPRIADARWGDANLAVVKWSQVIMLGEEKDEFTRLEEYATAIRANRQLAVALENQGINDDAARFAYHVQKLQRVVLRRQKKFGSYFFSLFLDLLAGYGYRSGRRVIWQLVTIFGFALVYFAIGHLPFFPDAFVFSLTSFHGRGFFPGLGSENSLHNPLVIMAAFEAVVGLLIEISSIATFTQRFFGR